MQEFFLRPIKASQQRGNKSPESGHPTTCCVAWAANKAASSCRTPKALSRKKFRVNSCDSRPL